MNNSFEATYQKIKKIAIFASGSGTNAENIFKYFQLHSFTRVSLIFTNNGNAGVIKRAENFNIPVIVFNRADFYQSNKVLNILKTENVDLIVLAGFLWLIPENIIADFKQRIVNIHPALLPKYGGKGMYGNYVHCKVIEMGERESGITIHYVNEKYDDGNIVFQTKCKVTQLDTPESLARKIHELEYLWYPKIIEQIIRGSL